MEERLSSVPARFRGHMSGDHFGEHEHDGRHILGDQDRLGLGAQLKSRLRLEHEELQVRQKLFEKTPKFLEILRCHKLEAQTRRLEHGI